MKQFVNPVFQPIDHSISQSFRRTEQFPKPPQPTAGGELPLEFEKIFSSETDISSRFNDSMIQPFDNYKYLREQSPRLRAIDSQYSNNTLSLTQVVDQKKYNNEILKYTEDDSLINSSFLGVLNQDMRPYQQIDSIYRKLEEPSTLHPPKNAQTLCDEDLKAELRDQVQDLWSNNKYLPPAAPQPYDNFGTTIYKNSNFQDIPIPAYPQHQNMNSYRSSESNIKPTIDTNKFGNLGVETNNFPSSPIKSRFVSQQMVKPLEIKIEKPNEKSGQKNDSYASGSKKQSLSNTLNSPDQFETIRITQIEQPEQQELSTHSTTQTPFMPMRHSSFINQQPTIQYNTKNKEVYYSQMVQPMNEKKLSRVVITNTKQNVTEAYQLPPELQQFSRKVPSPLRMNSPQVVPSESHSNRSSQKQIMIPTPFSYQNQQPIINKDKEQELFQQAERAVKFQRTQPKAIMPEWNKPPQNGSSETKKIPQQKQDDLQVLCVICEDLIPFEKVDTHSAGCLARSKQQAKTQNAHVLIESLNKKLEQLKQNILIQSNQQDSPQLKNVEIIEYITKIINCQKNYKKLKQYNDVLAEQYSKISENFDQKKFILILNLQRVLAVAQEKQLKLQFFEESNEGTLEDDSFLNLELNRINKKVELEKNNLEQAKFEHEMFLQIQKQDLENMKYLRAQYLEQNIDNEVLSQINSEWDVRNPETKTNRVTNSIVSDTQYQKDFDGFVRGGVGSPSVIINEDQKKAFYQLAVQIKLNLPHNHPGKNLLLQDTYEKAIKLKLARSGWEKFIIDEISNIKM